MPTADESSAQRALLGLLESGTDPTDRSSYVPGHLTVGAFLVNGSGAVLLVHHRKLAMWIEPGGHIEPTDATFEDAAARELLEETGMAATLVPDGIFDIDVHDIPASGSEPVHQHFNVSYLFEHPRGHLTAADEVLDARWVQLGDVADLTTDDAVMRAIGKLQNL